MSTPMDIAPGTTLSCPNPIGTGMTLADVAENPIAVDGLMAITGGAPDSELDPIQLGAPNDEGFRFAKIGLAVKAGTRFSLELPLAWQDKALIGWGNVNCRLASVFDVAGCTSLAPNSKWLVYPGGFWLKKCP